MAKDYETIQVLEVRRKTASSYNYVAEGKRGAPPDVIYPYDFHPKASMKFPIGTAARVLGGDYEMINRLRETAKERGASGMVEFRLALGGNGRGGAPLRAKLATGGARRGFKAILKEVQL